jgi:hypothetical protein
MTRGLAKKKGDRIEINKNIRKRKWQWMNVSLKFVSTKKYTIARHEVQFVELHVKKYDYKLQ